MRKSLLYVFAVICTMGFFTACGDDDDSSSSGNWQDLSKTYEGKSVNLVMGEVTILVDGKCRFFCGEGISNLEQYHPRK
jgi:hypothetical protein